MNTVKTLRDLRPLYNMIRNDPGLYWLKFRSSDALPDFEYFIRAVFWRRTLGIWLSILASLPIFGLILWGVILTESHVQNNRNYENVLGCVALILLCTIAAGVIEILGWQKILIDCWLNIEWTSAGFWQDVLSIVEDVSDYSFSQMDNVRQLHSHGKEEGNSTVPAHVIENCYRVMRRMAYRVKEIELTNRRFGRGGAKAEAEEARKRLREKLATYATYDIFKHDYDLNPLYIEAETKIRVQEDSAAAAFRLQKQIPTPAE